MYKRHFLQSAYRSTVTKSLKTTITASPGVLYFTVFYRTNAKTRTVVVLGRYPAHRDAVWRRRYHQWRLSRSRRRRNTSAEQGFSRGQSVAGKGPGRDTDLASPRIPQEWTGMGKRQLRAFVKMTSARCACCTEICIEYCHQRNRGNASRARGASDRYRTFLQTRYWKTFTYRKQ